jgi:hypothetical protein
MMEAVSTSETSVNFYQTTRRNIPEDSHLRTRRRENLISYLIRDDAELVTLLACIHDDRGSNLTGSPEFFQKSFLQM